MRITLYAAQDTGEECLSAPVQLGLWEEDVKVGELDTITPFHLVAYYFSLFWTWLEFYFVQLGSARLGLLRGLTLETSANITLHYVYHTHINYHLT